LKVKEGSGRVRHQWMPRPLPPTKKIFLTGFLRFAWTQLDSSGGGGGPDPWTPLASYAADERGDKTAEIKLFYKPYINDV